jgi:hypothetical protein
MWIDKYGPDGKINKINQSINQSINIFGSTSHPSINIQKYSQTILSTRLLRIPSYGRMTSFHSWIGTSGTYEGSLRVMS